MTTGDGERTIFEMLDACIDESTRVLHRSLDVDTGMGELLGIQDLHAYRTADLRIIENQLVIMRVLRELRGRL